MNYREILECRWVTARTRTMTQISVGVTVVAMLQACVTPSSRELGDADQRVADSARQDALETMPSGRGLSWTSDDGRSSGSVTPLRTFKNDATLLWCREYEELLLTSDNTVRQRKAACRSDDGIWTPARI